MNGLVVVAKKGNRYFTGGIKNNKFVRYREIKKLADLRYRDSYITLAAYLKRTKAKEKTETILANLKVDKLYVRADISGQPGTTVTPTKGKKAANAELPVTPAAFEKAFWAKINPACEACTKSCKQSARVTLVMCSQRTTK